MHEGRRHIHERRRRSDDRCLQLSSPLGGLATRIFAHQPISLLFRPLNFRWIHERRATMHEGRRHIAYIHIHTTHTHNAHTHTTHTHNARTHTAHKHTHTLTHTTKLHTKNRSRTHPRPLPPGGSIFCVHPHTQPSHTAPHTPLYPLRQLVGGCSLYEENRNGNSERQHGPATPNGKRPGHFVTGQCALGHDLKSEGG
jgi:hypothetical protein